MSKIQKALGRLKGTETEPGSDGLTTGRVQSNVGPSATASGGAGNRSGEPVPQFTIVSDTAQLAFHGLQVAHDDGGNLGQQFRRIKRPILNVAFGELGNGSPNANVIMVSSALAKTGKTFCSYNLAVSIARERDIGAVLVDADVLKPNISRAFGIEDRLGLIDYLLRPEIKIDDILVGTDMHGVVLVPAGQQHDDATELLASRRMEQLVSELSRSFQTRAIVVDTPPLLLTNEAHVLADHMGQIVFVIEAGVSSLESITNALESLNREKPINAILNKSRGSALGGYGSGYGGGYYGYYGASDPRGNG